ncbi:HlyD family secretion protein [Roseococcus sp. SYP-B2431]|nr:HlyD family secretion protein [Roseococcus sp. SYP-B2431]
MERRTPSTAQARVQAYVISMAPEVPGRVAEVAAADNSLVAAGRLLFRIDARPYEIAVEQAEARLAGVGQSLGASVSSIDAAQARVVDALANRDNIRQQAGRVMQLVQRGVYPQARYDEARAGLDRSEAAVAAAEAELERARRELGSAEADNPQMREALAALERARLDLSRTRVLAPADGVVTNLQLAPGQYVAAGHAALTFLDAGTIWLNAEFKENSLEYLRAGNRAEVVFDTFPGRVFPMRVESVGWGVASGAAPAAGLPTVRNDTGWVREAQRFPVRLVFAGERPRGIRHGSQAHVVVYARDNPVVNALGRLWIRLVAVLTYVS